jgi:hypothetical protein
MDQSQSNPVNPDFYQDNIQNPYYQNRYGNYLSPQQMNNQNSQIGALQPVRSSTQGLSNMVNSIVNGYQQGQQDHQQSVNQGDRIANSLQSIDLNQIPTGGVNAPYDPSTMGNTPYGSSTDTPPVTPQGGGINPLSLIQGLFGSNG